MRQRLRLNGSSTSSSPHLETVRWLGIPTTTPALAATSISGYPLSNNCRSLIPLLESPLSRQNDPAGNIIGCTVTVTYESDTSGRIVLSWSYRSRHSLDLHGLARRHRHNPGPPFFSITSDELAPIVTMELDTVGHLDGSDANFTSGYTAAQKLTASAAAPNFTPSAHILETSNTTYGLLPAGYTSHPTQSFKICYIQGPKKLKRCCVGYETAARSG